MTKNVVVKVELVLPPMCDKGDTENVFDMLAVYRSRLSVNRVVFLCRDMQPLRRAHSPNLDTRCHHPSYFGIGKCALNGENRKKLEYSIGDT